MADSNNWQLPSCQHSIGRPKNTTTVTRVSARNHVVKAIQKDKFKRSKAAFYQYVLDLKDEIEDELDELMEIQY